jgi:predicted CopG family antitoxin
MYLYCSPGENKFLAPPLVVENSYTSKLALKTFGQVLLDILQSMDQTQHETMLKVAENTFDTLRHLSIDYASFSKAVREYIECKSKLAGIEESMGGNFSREEFLGHYNDKKTQFDNISQRHVEAVSAYEASENNLQSLRLEVSCVKNLLPQLEKQLSFCEAETLRCRSWVTEISNHKSESERSLIAACEKMEQALKLEDERDSMVDAANAALENARVQLLQ